MRTRALLAGHLVFDDEPEVLVSRVLVVYRVYTLAGTQKGGAPVPRLAVYRRRRHPTPPEQRPRTRDGGIAAGGCRTGLGRVRVF